MPVRLLPVLLVAGCQATPEPTDAGGKEEPTETPAPTPTATSSTADTDEPGTTPSETGTATDPTDPYDGARQDCVDRINAFRATEGLPPYARWTDAEGCVDGQAQADSESGVPHSAFGQCGEWAQNECPGWPADPEVINQDCLQMMWDEGPGEPFSEHGHYLNMSNASYTQVACGFYATPDGSMWATQDFR